MSLTAGLRFPADSAAWRRWEQSRHPLRRTSSRLRRHRREAPAWVLHSAGSDPRLLVAVDSAHATHALALLEPLRHLDPSRVAVLAPRSLTKQLPPAAWTTVPFDPLTSQLPTTRAVLSTGDFLPIGAFGRTLAERDEAPYLVVQHGLLTPYAPPLARSAHVLAFSQADADFWASGRHDVQTTVVGSQLLWTAEETPGPAPTDARPVYLGQLHAAELSRSRLARAAVAFCRDHDAAYRPHPSERDRVSRLLHATWRRRGVRFAPLDVPLADLPDPVVSVFSTGVLEAAARGRAAWVSFPNPPTWLQEFWERYDMRSYGGDPTPAPGRPDVEPALAIARLLESL